MGKLGKRWFGTLVDVSVKGAGVGEQKSLEPPITILLVLGEVVSDGRG